MQLKKKIYTTFDTQNQTWNAMNGHDCLFYGSIDELENWLDVYGDNYQIID